MRYGLAVATLLFILPGAAGNDPPPEPLDRLLENIRQADAVDGCAVSSAARPGRFFLASEKVLARARLDDYRAMLGDPNPYVRVMGVLGIALHHPGRRGEVSLSEDREE